MPLGLTLRTLELPGKTLSNSSENFLIKSTARSLCVDRTLQYLLDNPSVSRLNTKRREIHEVTLRIMNAPSRLLLHHPFHFFAYMYQLSFSLSSNLTRNSAQFTPRAQRSTLTPTPNKTICLLSVSTDDRSPLHPSRVMSVRIWLVQVGLS